MFSLIVERVREEYVHLGNERLCKIGGMRWDALHSDAKLGVDRGDHVHRFKRKYCTALLLYGSMPYSC